MLQFGCSLGSSCTVKPPSHKRTNDAWRQCYELFEVLKLLETAGLSKLKKKSILTDTASWEYDRSPVYENWTHFAQNTLFVLVTLMTLQTRENKPLVLLCPDIFLILRSDLIIAKLDFDTIFPMHAKCSF
jgi:hypothetical protein